jgi:hypothetical protein
MDAGDVATVLCCSLGSALGTVAALKLEFRHIWRELRAINLFIGREKT